jgi:hypothetical protein
MKTVSPDRLDAAETFVWVSGRLVDRLRFASLFRAGNPQRVVEALRPYRNLDGGFGEALEPDFRGPISQPVTVMTAFHMLDEVNACDDPMVSDACDWLTGITVDGGVPIALPNIAAYPRAWWWSAPEGKPRPSLLPTAGIASVLHNNHITHPWLAGATQFCWRAIAELEQRERSLGIEYVYRMALSFLDHVPDRRRAEQAAVLLRKAALDRGLVALDPETQGEVHFPLDFAPEANGLARSWFDDKLIARHLDHLVSTQAEDGGWTFNWGNWSALATLESRAWITIQRLKTLKSYGRLS